MPDAAPSNDLDIPSPCIAICQLDAQNICIGCLRTDTEIKAWYEMDNEARRILLEKLKQRRRAAGRTNARDSKPRRRAKS